MRTRDRQACYPLGLVVFVLLLAVYKAIRLTADMGAGWGRSVPLLGADAFYLALIFLLALLQGASGRQWLRATARLVLFVLMLYYLVDSLVLLALDQHVSLFEIGRYAPEWGIVTSFFDAKVLTVAGLMLVAVFIRTKPEPAVLRTGLILSGAALLAAGFNLVYAPSPLRHYAVLDPVQLLENPGRRQPVTAYTPEEIAFYSVFGPAPASIPASKPDIILLVVESLSSINSEKLSGMPGLLDRFDELAAEGVLFSNFFANHQASEGGLISLLGGFPPIHFPTASPYMFDEFATQDTVLAEYRQQGYFTDFLTNAELSFIGLDRFLNGLGMDRSRGRDEVDAMRNAPRVVQDAPPDTLLYREALSSLRQLRKNGQPFLLTMATTSTHLPYTHPEGGPDTPAAVWDWSMRQLVRFYAELRETGFFDHGILLITGDHRQMRPVSDAEALRYGDSARARVPLLVVGRGFQGGLIDERFFQQSDLLRMLGRINQPGVPLSPHPLWVERYNRKYGHSELIDNLGVFDEADRGRHEYLLRVPGDRIEWTGGKPPFARALELRIHAQRSMHQQKRQSVGPPAIAD
jgi:lipoteichoic acid synthase